MRFLTNYAKSCDLGSIMRNRNIAEYQKPCILNKCVNYFCPWKYESMFSCLSFDAAEFRHDEVSLVWAKLFVYKQKICTFSSWFLVYINKSEIIWIIEDHPFINSNCCNQNFVRKEVESRSVLITFNTREQNWNEFW